MNDLHELMHDRLATETVDLAALAEGAMRRGRRIRRVRRTGAGLAAVAVVAGVSVGVATLADGSDNAGTPIGPATSTSGSTTNSLPAPDAVGNGSAFGLPSGRMAISRIRPGRLSQADPARRTEFVVPAGATRADIAYLHAHYPGFRIVRESRPSITTDGHVDLSTMKNVGGGPGNKVPDAQSGPTPVTVSAPGWTCTAYPADQKTGCTKGGYLVSVNWTTAADPNLTIGPRDGTTHLLGRGVTIHDDSALADGVFVAVSSPGSSGLVVTVQGSSAADVAAVAPYVAWT